MSDLVDPGAIERIVGVPRHASDHYARAISAEQTVYILHSQACKGSGIDLRDCPFSLALDDGITSSDWVGHEDRPVIVAIDGCGYLIPASAGTGEQGEAL